MKQHNLREKINRLYQKMQSQQEHIFNEHIELIDTLHDNLDVRLLANEIINLQYLLHIAQKAMNVCSDNLKTASTCGFDNIDVSTEQPKLLTQNEIDNLLGVQ